MTPQVKAALIIAGAIIIATTLWIYFSPYQTCLRAFSNSLSSANGAIRCTGLLGGSG